MRTVAAPLCILAAVTACDDGGAARARARLLAAQARVDAPELWRVRIVHEALGGRPVLICADSFLRAGFASVVPATGDRHCSGMSARTVTAAGESYRFSLDGVAYAVTTAITGDRSRDFLARSTVHAVTGVSPDYARSLRFERVGSCPDGWRRGDTTNQAGRRLRTTAWVSGELQ